MGPLVIASTGGLLTDGTGDPVPVQRTFLTVHSIELDTVLVAGAPAAAADAEPEADAMAGAPAGDNLDSRVVLLLSEAYRHGKAMGGWGDAVSAFEAAGVPADAAGIEVGEDPAEVLTKVVELLGSHRVWERFTA